MTRRKIQWTQQASTSLDGIYKFLVKQSQSEKIAAKYVYKILERVDAIAHSTEANPVEPFLQQIGQNSRFIIVGFYKIIYQYDDERIYITDVFHTKQNPGKLIRRNKKK